MELEVLKMAEIKKAKVKQSNITQAVDLLQDLPKKVKEEHSLREAVKAMYPTIRGVLKKGYSYSEVATMLKKAEITISGATLRQYVQEIVKQHKKSSQIVQKDERSSSSEVVQSQTIDSDEVSPEREVVSVVDVVVDRAEVETDTEIETDVTETTSDLKEDAQQNVINPHVATNTKSRKLRQSGQPGQSTIENEFNK
jgi:uncharacterized membrane protein